MLFQEKSDVETPRHIYGDNEASTFLANNKQASNIKSTSTLDINLLENVLTRERLN